MDPATAAIWIMMTLTDGQQAVSDFGPDGRRLTADVCRREAHKLRYGGVVELREHLLIVSQAKCFACNAVTQNCTELLPLEIIDADAPVDH